MLKEAKRYRFAEHEDDRKSDTLKSSDTYWSKIESGNLYIPSGKISNLNIHYKLPKAAEEKTLQDVAITLDDLKKILAQAKKTTVKIETKD